MRLFFLFLLIINLLFAAWQYYQPARQSASIQPLPDELQTIQLLHESQPVKQPVEIVEQLEDAPVVPRLEVISKLQPACFTLGPFNDEASVQQIRGRLEDKASSVSMRKKEENRVHRYWVYLPAFDSRKQAIAKSRELGRKKVKDYYIVRSGDNNNSISLGHFKEKAHADRRVKKLKRLGFEPELEVIYRSFDVYWLDYALDSDDESHEQMIKEFDIEAAALLKRDCE